MISNDELRELIIETLDKNKAEDVTIIDLINKSNIADYMIIATGRSNKHASSVAQILLQKIKETGRKYSVEGLDYGDWVLIDTMDILVHIFNKEKRELYSLEKLWQ